MSFLLNPVLAGLPTTIFTHMSALAVAHGAVNLGQGFPDMDGPLAIRQAAAKALIDGPNQYAPMRGQPELRQAIAAHAATHYGLAYDPDREVIVTCGATEAIVAALFAVARPGAEVVLVEPTYDSYRPIAEAAGLTVKSVVLSPPDWRLTQAALDRAITPRTAAILINSPQNPIGRVLTRAELEGVAAAAQKADCVVICDEAYEHLAYDGPHIPLATLPGMRERTLRIGSAGKIFSFTGWKIGWLAGPPSLTETVAKAHQFLTFAIPGALQKGVAHGLTQAMDFPPALRERLQANRDFLGPGLARLGFEVLPCEGTYFLVAGIAGLTAEKDLAYCERLVREAGVAAIPLSAFFHDGKVETYVRFVFCKERPVLEEALRRLERYLRPAARSV
jgi:aspartate/methionine/tyrosine aminotransferase